MDKGIDYGMGLANVDKSNGIRYGVISVHSVLQAWADSSEPNYGEPSCGKCGNDAVPYDKDKHSGEGWECDWYEGSAEYACEDCKYMFSGEAAYPDEALGYTLDDGEYQAEDCLDSDIIITKSPYYTFAQFCSPCVPGAGNLNNPCETGPKSYCFGHNWFDEGKAPYIVYRVSDDSVVEAD